MIARSWWREHRDLAMALVFVAPALAFFAVFKYYPMVQAGLLSFYEYDLLSPPRFVGVRNYASLLTDSMFHQSILNSFAYVAGVAVPVWLFALGLALVFNRPGRVRDFFQVVYFLPAVSSVIVAAIVWKFLFHPLGLVNVLLSYVGVGRTDWLTRLDTAMIALIIAGIWRTVPYFMVLCLAGLKGISLDYYEAASLDGAGPWQQFRYITLPLMQPTLALVVIMSVILLIRHFINPLIMTGGGPVNATRVLPLLIYQTGFEYSKMGLASAMSMVFFVIVMGFSLLQLRLFRRMSG